MKLFRRSDTNETVPPELEQYYDEQPRWKLWVRRIVGVIVLLLIVFAIGWAAWAVYNRVTDDGVDENNNDQNQNSQNEGQSSDNEHEQNGGSDHEAGSGSTSGGSSNGTQGSANGQSGQDGTATTVPAAGDESGNAAASMPKTGPENVFIIAGVAVILGAGSHYYLTNRRIRS